MRGTAVLAEKFKHCVKSHELIELTDRAREWRMEL